MDLLDDYVNFFNGHYLIAIILLNLHKLVVSFAIVYDVFREAKQLICNYIYNYNVIGNYNVIYTL